MDYDTAVDLYEADLKDYEEAKKKVDGAEKKAEELNRRFGQWYYVIPGESYDKLALDRKDVLKDREKVEPDDNAETGPGAPPTLNLPQVQSSVPEKTTEDKPADEPAKESKETGDKATKKEEAPVSEPAEPNKDGDQNYRTSQAGRGLWQGSRTENG